MGHRDQSPGPGALRLWELSFVQGKGKRPYCHMLQASTYFWPPAECSPCRPWAWRGGGKASRVSSLFPAGQPPHCHPGTARSSPRPERVLRGGPAHALRCRTERTEPECRRPSHGRNAEPLGNSGPGESGTFQLCVSGRVPGEGARAAGRPPSMGRRARAPGEACPVDVWLPAGGLPSTSGVLFSAPGKPLWCHPVFSNRAPLWPHAACLPRGP